MKIRNVSTIVCAAALAGLMACSSGSGDETASGNDALAQKDAGAAAPAPIHRECTLVKLLDDNVLEESFGTDAPDVTMDRNAKGELTVSIGDSAFRAGKDTIMRLTKSTATDVEVQMDQMEDGVLAKPGGKIAQTVTLSITGKTGVLSVAVPKKPVNKFATLSCKPAAAPTPPGQAACPPDGTIDCQPVTTKAECAPAKRSFISANCPGVHFLD